ncbi:MAG: hypothetical protein LBT40_10790 [Deltaproteobacteria bacterium]|jgi:hypothetical protein|nr:hypothetical protein [Deltaproteobacteria bacterium]
MFSRIKARTDPRRLGYTYCRWDFGLGLAQRLAELGFLACLLTFLAEDIWGVGGLLLPGVAGHVLAALLMMGAFALARLPVGLARIQLDHAFGLDTRPFRARAASFLARLAVLVPAGAAGTLALYAALPVLGPLAWGGAYLALVWLALALWLMLPRVFILSEKRLRSPLEGELPPGTEKYLTLLSSGQVKISLDDVLVSTSFYPGLPAPFTMSGKILVPERALRGFPPKALEVRVAAAALCRVVSSGRSITLLRFFSMALAVPASLILLNSVGILFGYPIVARPGVIALVWAGVWASFWFSEFAALYVERSVSARVSATVAAVTLDARSLFESVELSARGNLDPGFQTPFLDLFRPRQNPVSQFESIKKSIQEMVDAASKRRAIASAGKGEAAGDVGKPDAGEMPESGGTASPGSGKASWGTAAGPAGDAGGKASAGGNGSGSVQSVRGSEGGGPTGGHGGAGAAAAPDGLETGGDGTEGPGKNGYN